MVAALEALARLSVSPAPLEAVLDAFVEHLEPLVNFDGLALALLDSAGTGAVLLDPPGRRELGAGRQSPVAVAGTPLGPTIGAGRPRRVDDGAGTLGPGWRAALLAPLSAGAAVTGVVIVAARRPAAFTDVDLTAVGTLSHVLAGAVEMRRLRADSRRHAEELDRRTSEMRALLEAGRAVTASLDVSETVRRIMEEARSVLGVHSCSVMTRDAATGELVTVASLDLPGPLVARIRVRAGEGISGRAVSERRPVQSEDLFVDPRVRFPDLPRRSGLRSMLAAPLRIGQHVIGAISVFRHDVHRFTADEERLLVALADQAAIALEHARLYGEQEAAVAARTRELDAQKRFVEVVLETLPLGVVVLDPGLAVVRANDEAMRAFGSAGIGAPVTALVPEAQQAGLEKRLQASRTARVVTRWEDEMTVAGETKTFRFTAAPVEREGNHLVLLVEDITPAKRLERQMLLTERLTTAGRMAAGVAHELNNPLATIAGCAEALRDRLREGGLESSPVVDDFRHYLGLIEEEAYRCKEITSSLLQFVRDPGSRRTPTDLNGLVLKTIELLGHQGRFKARRFLTELQPDLPAVEANEGQLRQVFLGIAANGLEAMDAEGVLRVRTRQRRQEVEVEFEDEGPGIPEELLPRIFDPFFTTKPPGQGTGLGLAIAQGIVADHGGRIEATSRPGKGSLFRVVLPV